MLPIETLKYTYLNQVGDEQVCIGLGTYVCKVIKILNILSHNIARVDVGVYVINVTLEP